MVNTLLYATHSLKDKTMLFTNSYFMQGKKDKASLYVQQPENILALNP